jgi:hypothetical protein
MLDGFMAIISVLTKMLDFVANININMFRVIEYVLGLFALVKIIGYQRLKDVRVSNERVFILSKAYVDTGDVTDLTPGNNTKYYLFSHWDHLASPISRLETGLVKLKP